MSREIRLHLIRHPPPCIAAGICYGQLDMPAEPAEAAAADLREQLAGIPVWSSPLRRCHDFARAIDAGCRVDPRLMEMSFGAWEGRRWDDIERPAMEAWAADLWGFAPPGGESAAMVWQRLEAFLAAVHTPEVALVTHAGVIRLLLARHAGRPLGEWLDHPVPYAKPMKNIAFVIF